MKIMKNIKKIVLFILITMTFGSCAFFKNQHEIARQREKPFTVDMNSTQVPLGGFEAQFDSAFPMMPLRSANVNVIYFPVEDAVCFHYRLDTINFYQFWNREGRDFYVTALAKYERDFEARNLRSTRSGNTKNLYGITDGFLIWQSFGMGVRARSSIDLELGYYFRERSPFFAITQGEGNYENLLGVDENEDMVAGEKPMYLTRSQAAEIAAFFDFDFLRSKAPVSQFLAPSEQRPPAEFDEY